MSKPTKMHAIVECKIHGKQAKEYAGTMVKVNNIPFTKKEKRAGWKKKKNSIDKCLNVCYN